MKKSWKDLTIVVEDVRGRRLPFRVVPDVGDTVASCGHEPRPMHHQFFEDRPIVDGVRVRWVNVCETCSDLIRTSDSKAVCLNLCMWTQTDADRLREEARTRERERTN